MGRRCESTWSACITLTSLNERWAISLQADYVRNYGARTPEDTGYAGTFTIGQLSTPGDWRLSYGYAVAETDAVLAAFSNDNTTYSTNYRHHSLIIDYQWLDRADLNLTA